MLKPKEKTAEYKDDFEPPQEWEQLRDGEGEPMEGSFRTIPSVISDDL